MGVSENSGTPKWMVKIMENPIKMGWFGGKTHFFWKPPYNWVHQVYTTQPTGTRARSSSLLRDGARPRYWTPKITSASTSSNHGLNSSAFHRSRAPNASPDCPKLHVCCVFVQTARVSFALLSLLLKETSRSVRTTVNHAGCPASWGGLRKQKPRQKKRKRSFGVVQQGQATKQ